MAGIGDMGLYVLEGHTPVRVDDTLTWGSWMAVGNRRVAITTIGDVEVSTVFLGIDHCFGDGAPMLFETMIFNGKGLDRQMWRYSTWDEAEAGHGAAVELERLKVATLDPQK